MNSLFACLWVATDVGCDEVVVYMATSMIPEGQHKIRFIRAATVFVLFVDQ